jgi:uncharacterized protein with HEPN domain
VRPEHDLVTDIARHARLILDLIDDLDEAGFLQRFGDGINPFGAAISFALVAIGEACRQLVGAADTTDGRLPASIVIAHPDIDWRGWTGLRNVLTHGYHRRDPPVIWRAIGELRALVQACEAWQATRTGPDA